MKQLLNRTIGAMNRAVSAASMRFHIATANLWRDQYNPLRGLTISHAVTLLEDGERGAYADLQWLYRYIEMQDATLGALIERRTSAVQEMGWEVKIPEGLDEADEAIAEAQAERLRETYNNIRDLKGAIEFLCMASFKGYSHLEVIKENGEIISLSPIEQWYMVRPGLNGDWMYNPKSRSGTTKGDRLDGRLFITREVARPINRVALISFVRKSMSQKDWDGFVETYGIPSVFIIAPENITEEQHKEYQEVANRISGDARGVLPGGSKVESVDNGARGVNPFADHIKHQDEQVVLRGTGGKLTMLAESGSGTLGGSAHSDTFNQIARAEAAEISELLQCVIDENVLNESFPGQDHLAYFEISANEETEVSEIVKEIGELSTAGYHVSDDQVSERTGYTVVSNSANFNSANLAELNPPVNPEALNLINRIMNRADGAVETRAQEVFTAGAETDLRRARASDLQDIGRRLEEIGNMSDPSEFSSAIAELSNQLPEMTSSEASAEEFEKILMSSFINGLADNN